MKTNLLLCNGIEENNIYDKKHFSIEKLDSISSDANVNIQIEDISRAFLKNLSQRIIDFLEIAAYIYAADSAKARGKGWSENGTRENWQREFNFIIGVRDYEFWQDEKIIASLKSILNFLSDDSYSFDFRKLSKDRSYQEYLALDETADFNFKNPDKVIMFSGGLDSLSGAIESLEKGERTVLVSHRSFPSIDKRQRDLSNQLKAIYPNQIIHIPVWLNKDKNLFREYTQRTRSFLYATLGTVVSSLLNCNKICFYENGIVSLNLPVADEVLRARASRTTHPVFLHKFSELASFVCNEEKIIDNPFIFCTKKNVIQKIESSKKSALIGYSCSCTHTKSQTKSQWHCGGCSQCIDRKIAIESLGLSKYDPDVDYVENVFIGERKEGYDKNMATNFARHVIELAKISEIDFSKKFNLEISRAVRPFKNKREAAAEFYRIHSEFGDYASQTIISKLNQYASELFSGSLPNSSMLALVAGQAHTKSVWINYATQIVNILTASIPKVFKSTTPKNEPHLQEYCDGVLSTHFDDLVREFPFLRWASRMTKPDWSNDELNLWVELKYIREKKDIRQITEDIAADITKYSDNNRFILFVIYDPLHLVEYENKFKSEMTDRENVIISFIR